jgi:photosystem II stability/assembly factor-like uncharacterized protein
VRRLLTRNRALAAGAVVAVVGVIAGLGAVSRSSPVTVAGPATAGVPAEPWYWTLAVAPSDPRTLVLATSNGVFRSTDGGSTWAQTGLRGVNTTSLAEVGGTLFAAGVPGPVTIVRTAAGRTAPNGKGVVAASTDEGATWRTVHPKGLPATTVQSLATDPAGKTLYALLVSGALYRSTDGGRSFRLVTAKVGIAPWALAVAQGGELVSGDMDGGSHVSRSGTGWRPTPFTDSSGGRMVMEYAVQPGDPARVIMTSRGIALSTDAGRTWRLVLRSQVMFGPVAYAPSASSLAYAVGFDGSLWRSDDGGTSWTKVA